MLNMIPGLAGSSAGGGALANFFSKLGTGGLGGFLGGLGNVATGLPVSQVFGLEASPMNSMGQLLGSGLMDNPTFFMEKFAGMPLHAVGRRKKEQKKLTELNHDGD